MPPLSKAGRLRAGHRLGSEAGGLTELGRDPGLWLGQVPGAAPAKGRARNPGAARGWEDRRLRCGRDGLGARRDARRDAASGPRGCPGGTLAQGQARAFKTTHGVGRAGATT